MAQVIGGSKTPVCGGADLLELVEVHRVGQLKRYKGGTLLFWQDDPVECLFLVKTGKAKTFSLSPAGKAPWVEQFDDGSYIIRPRYRVEQGGRHDDSYVHAYRTMPLWSFAQELGLVAT